MNILDWTGPEFLTVYGALMAAVTLAATAVHLVAAGPFSAISKRNADFDPLEVAVVAGGRRRALETAIGALAAAGIVRVDGPRSFRRATPLPSRRHRFEQAVYERIPAEQAETVERIASTLDTEFQALERRPRQFGLLVAPSTSLAARLVAAALPASLVVLGVAKVSIGLSREKPVLILCLLCALTALLGVACAARWFRRSVRGLRYCHGLHSDTAALRASAASDPQRLARDDVALALALGGCGLFASTALSDVGTALVPPRPVRTNDGSDAGGGCGGGGGGCGGGGCGGCGS